mgnify:CR=1 FL=1
MKNRKKLGVKKDKSCKLPQLFPGDIVENEYGILGVITEAGVTTNGGSIKWNEKLPLKIEHGHLPSYAIIPLHAEEYFGKTAWWTMSEIHELVALGPAHTLKKETYEH